MEASFRGRQSVAKTQRLKARWMNLRGMPEGIPWYESWTALCPSAHVVSAPPRSCESRAAL